MEAYDAKTSFGDCVKATIYDQEHRCQYPESYTIRSKLTKHRGVELRSSSFGTDSLDFSLGFETKGLSSVTANPSGRGCFDSLGGAMEEFDDMSLAFRFPKLEAVESEESGGGSSPG